MAKTLTQLRDMFKKYAGDNSLNTTEIDFRMTDTYKDFRQKLWNTNAKWLLPVTIQNKTSQYDTSLWRYITIPNTAVAWRLLRNEQLMFTNDWTNYKIYLRRGNGIQTIEWIDEQTLPSTDPSIYTDECDKAIVMDAVADYFFSIKAPEEEAMMRKRADDVIKNILQWFKQDFIYNSNDLNETIEVNIQ